MHDIAWLPPLVRALTTALLVVSASVAAEALGPFWGSLIATFPVVAGPAYVFLAMRHGDGFLATSALSSAVANAATGMFLIVYGLLASRLPPGRTLVIAVLTWVSTVMATRAIVWTPVTALLLNAAIYGAGFLLLTTVKSVAPRAVSLSRRKWFELPARALAVAAFVSLVISASSLLGPNTTGIAAVFPLSLISLLVIVRPRIGGPASALLAANALRAMLGFGVMLLVLHLGIPPWGAPIALSAALGVSILWSAALLQLERLRPNRSPVTSHGRSN